MWALTAVTGGSAHARCRSASTWQRRRCAVHVPLALPLPYHPLHKGCVCACMCNCLGCARGASSPSRLRHPAPPPPPSAERKRCTRPPIAHLPPLRQGRLQHGLLPPPSGPPPSAAPAVCAHLPPLRQGRLQHGLLPPPSGPPPSAAPAACAHLPPLRQGRLQHGLLPHQHLLDHLALGADHHALPCGRPRATQPPSSKTVSTRVVDTRYGCRWERSDGLCLLPQLTAAARLDISTRPVAVSFLISSRDAHTDASTHTESAPGCAPRCCEVLRIHMGCRTALAPPAAPPAPSAAGPGRPDGCCARAAEACAFSRCWSNVTCCSISWSCVGSSNVSGVSCAVKAWSPYACGGRTGGRWAQRPQHRLPSADTGMVSSLCACARRAQWTLCRAWWRLRSGCAVGLPQANTRTHASALHLARPVAEPRPRRGVHIVATLNTTRPRPPAVAC